MYILGYSLGGHVTLAFGLPDGYGGLVRPGAALRRDPRVRAVASVCAPLDLASSSAAIDQPSGFVYRGHVLDGLREIYAEVARRRPVPAPLAAVREIKTIREWDRRVIVPRHGFRDEHDYYQRVSVGPHLSGLELPTLIVSTTGDPMIPVHTVAPSLRDLPDHVLTRWVRGGGHVGYPGASDLGFGPVYGVESQIVAWMQRHR